MARDWAGSPTQGDLDDRLRRLHAHLAATGERPVRRAAARWLGEAEAVAADVAGAVPRSVVTTRVAQIGELLDHVDETGDAEADTHVEAARREARAIRDAIGADP